MLVENQGDILNIFVYILYLLKLGGQGNNIFMHCVV